MSAAPAATVFGAGDLQSLESQLNVWTPQIELTLKSCVGRSWWANATPYRERENGAHESHRVVSGRA